MKSKNYLYEDCIESLKQNSKEILKMFELDNELTFSAHPFEYSISRYWDKASSSEIKQHLLEKDEMSIVHDSIIQKALNFNDLKFRQTIAKSLNKIPSELKEDYESLLNDKSYITIETALFNLWNNFLVDRSKIFK